MPVSKASAISVFASLLFTCAYTQAGEPSYLMFSIAKAKCIKDPTPTCQSEVAEMREELYTVKGVLLPDDADVKRRDDQFTLVSSDSYLSVDGTIKSLTKSLEQEAHYESTSLTIERQEIPENEDLAKPIIIELEERE